MVRVRFRVRALGKTLSGSRMANFRMILFCRPYGKGRGEGKGVRVWVLGLGY
jgi:hypothetical protein